MKENDDNYLSGYYKKMYDFWFDFLNERDPDLVAEAMESDKYKRILTNHQNQEDE